MASPVPGLSLEHYAELSFTSGISDDTIRLRGYQSVRTDQLPDCFPEYQRRDGLLIPIRTVRGEIESYQLKPDTPRIGKNGKPIKYETAANARQVIDVPPAMLPHLADPKQPLVITEGAKKVDAAISAGLVSTIGLQGVYGWRGTGSDGGKTALADWESIAFNDRQVLIAFDSDVMTKATVRAALERLAAFLTSRGARPCFLLLPPLKDGAKCGLDDYFALAHTIDDLNQHIVAQLPPIEPSPAADAPGIPRLVARSMAEVEAKEIAWLWPGWLPKGMLALLGGYAGDGKSTLSVALAAALSIGGTLPDGTTAPVTDTLLVLAEDDVSHVVKGRLDIHNADARRVHTLDHVVLPDGSERGFNLKTDVPILRQLVEARGIGLIVIDPLSSIMSSSDRNNEGEVRDTLNPLIKMAEETGCAVLGIMHIGKTDGHAKAYQKLMGSTAYTALARTVWMVSELPADFQAEGEPVRKMIGVAKSNYAVAPAPLQYCRPLDGALEWLGGSPLGIDEVFNRLKKAGDGEGRTSETEKAEEWLLELMDGKPMAATAISSAALDMDISARTLRRAKDKTGVTSKKDGGVWMWLPPVSDVA